MKQKLSSTCKDLAKSTIAGEIKWIRCDEFQEYLDVSGLSINCVGWFHDYLRHLQRIRNIPILNRLYFVFYQKRIFAISKSKYSGAVRLDFTSNLEPNRVWRGVIAPQPQLMQLLSLIEVTDFDNINESCAELLYSTGCIHA